MTHVYILMVVHINGSTYQRNMLKFINNEDSYFITYSCINGVTKITSAFKNKELTDIDKVQELFEIHQ